MPDPIVVIPGLVVAAVAANWLAERLGIPSVLTLLAVGVIVGPVLRVVDPAAMFGELLTPMVSVAVAVVLFEGGLSLRSREVEGSHPIIWTLVTAGVLVTWGIGALAALAFTDLGMGASILLGSILVVSGPTVVGPILRTVRPSRRVGSILKWESIFIDPVGAMLAVITFNLIIAERQTFRAGDVVIDVLAFVADGGITGGVLAAAAIFVLRRHWVPEHLVSLFGLATALSAYLVAETFVHESGLLATTVVGLVLANHRQIRTESIVRFSEDVRVLLIGVLFIVLSARLTRDQILSIGWGAFALVAVLVLIARPLAVWISTLRSDLDRRERMLLAGVAPRGIVAASIASVFGLELEEAGVPGAELVTPLAFAVIVFTVVIYGLGVGPLARRLGLASRSQEGVLVLGAGPVERAVGLALQEAGLDVVVATVNSKDEQRARTAGLQTFYGNVLDEHFDLRLEMSGIGKLFALTSNVEVNTLAARKFADVFGRGETYQLAADDAPPGVEGGAADLGGRPIFASDLDYGTLRTRLRTARIRSAKVDGEFDFEAVANDVDARSVRDGPNEDAVPLFAIRDGRLLVAAVDAPVPLADRVQPGDWLFWLEGDPSKAAPGRDAAPGT